MKKAFAALLGCLAVVALTPVEAAAQLQLKLQSGLETIVVTDGSPNDSNTTPGVITYSGTIAGSPVVVTTVILNADGLAYIDFSGISLAGNANTLTVSATATGFPGLAGATTKLTSAIGGTTYGTTFFQGSLDTANVPFGASCSAGPQGPLTGAFDRTEVTDCVLSGRYSVSAVLTVSLPKGQTQSFGAQVYTDCTLYLGDFVWHDQNNNGIQDSGEPGIDGVTVELRDTNNGDALIATDVTGPNGAYLFSGLCGGKYTVNVKASTVPAGFFKTVTGQGFPATDSNPDPYIFELPNNSSDLTIDFGYTNSCTAELGDYVWLDLDKDGVQNPNEPGVDNVTVLLLDSTGNPLNPPRQATTGNGGVYKFTGLCPGDYIVMFVPPPGVHVHRAQCRRGRSN